MARQGNQGSNQGGNRRGFAAMDEDKRRELASRGGKARAQQRQGENQGQGGNEGGSESGGNENEGME